MRHRLSWGLLLFAFVCEAAFAVEPAAAAAAVPRASAPATAHDDRPALERAVAGVVVGALATKFGGRAVEARFGAIEQRLADGAPADGAADAGQHVISGDGQMRFAGETSWIGFRFRARYDVLLGQVGTTEVVLAVGGDARPVPNDTSMVRQLDDRLVDSLRGQWGLPSVRLQLDRIETVETGQHYLLIDADGLADFGRDGSSGIRISAFYDRRSGQWLQLDYDLDAPPQPAVPSLAVPPLAGR